MSPTLPSPVTGDSRPFPSAAPAEMSAVSPLCAGPERRAGAVTALPALTSWTSQASLNGSPVPFAVSVEAVVRLLAAGQVDMAALRAELRLPLGA